LQQSKVSRADPTDFVRSLRDGIGQPLNVNAQMDVHEFWNLLFDILEGNLQTTHQPDLLRETFGGVLSNQYICQGGSHYISREERFSYLSIVVKHHETIAEGLKQFVQGEMLSGSNAYLCTECQSKQSTIRRSVIQTLPGMRTFTHN